MERTIEIHKKRDKVIDIVRGILMISVLLGHTNWNFSDYIYYFHMPAFFILSGMLVNSEKPIDIRRFMRDIIRTIVIGFIWYIIDLVLHDKLTIKMVIMYFWGGRLLSGVYWFMPVLIICRYLFIIIERFKHKYVIYLALFIVSITESFIFDGFSKYPMYLNLPLNIDSCTFAIIYLKIGSMYKNLFDKFLKITTYRMTLAGIWGGTCCSNNIS